MARLTGTAKSVRRARKLRRKMTLPEVLLWKELRKRPDDLKFRRQHPAGPYILDFFCGELNLAIEVDGESHGMGDNPVHDRRRDEWLKSNGITVLRITARDVLNELENVILQIRGAARNI